MRFFPCYNSRALNRLRLVTGSGEKGVAEKNNTASVKARFEIGIVY